MSGDSVPLADDRYAPITSTIGFVNVDLASFVDALVAWRTTIRDHVSVRHLDGGLARNIRALEPLTIGSAPRELVVGLDNTSWVAMFNCDFEHTDLDSPIGHLTRTNGWWGLVVTSIPDRVSATGVGPFAATSFELFGPHRTDWLNQVRAVEAVQDGAKWTFGAGGEVQEWEEPEAYNRRRVRDRLTDEMLARYISRCVGIDAVNIDSYVGPCVLVETDDVVLDHHVMGSIEEAQRLQWIVDPTIPE